MHEIHSSPGPIGQGRLQADLLSNLPLAYNDDRDGWKLSHIN